MTNITRFEFNTAEVRVINIDGSPWFVAGDVLDAIGSSTTVTAVENLVVKDLGKEFVSNQHLDTAGGLQEMLVLSEAALTLVVSRSRTELGKHMTRWIHVEVLPSIRKTGKYEIETQTPQTYLEALKSLVASEEVKLVLQAENELLQAEKESLEQDNLLLSEAVDELFNYSSIIRIAKFNNVSETQFKWRTLKALSLKMCVEIKRVPDPRFETKLLYHHDVWRVAYPNMSLPETTTLVIHKAA